VANTNLAPVSCATVRIGLSTDGGYTYPTTLLDSTPNDGAAPVTVPPLPSGTVARVRVACNENIFFDISDAGFVITAPDLTIQKTHLGLLKAGQPLTYTLTIANMGLLTTTGTVTVTDILPLGLTAVSFEGDGWVCDLDSLTCTRDNPLPEGIAFPALTLVAQAAPDVPETVLNQATVAGGGDTNPTNNLDSDLAGEKLKLFMPYLLR